MKWLHPCDAALRDGYLTPFGRFSKPPQPLNLALRGLKGLPLNRSGVTVVSALPSEKQCSCPRCRPWFFLLWWNAQPQGCGPNARVKSLIS
jgi:hypothetical protein